MSSIWSYFFRCGKLTYTISFPLGGHFLEIASFHSWGRYFNPSSLRRIDARVLKGQFLCSFIRSLLNYAELNCSFLLCYFWSCDMAFLTKYGLLRKKTLTLWQFSWVNSLPPWIEYWLWRSTLKFKYNLYLMFNVNNFFLLHVTSIFLDESNNSK